jgi:hypothetical protein
MTLTLERGRARAIVTDRPRGSDDGLVAGEWRLVGNTRRYVPAVPVLLEPFTLGVTCDDCGCLLTSYRERCPSCLVWAERTAVALTWLAFERGHR